MAGDAPIYRFDDFVLDVPNRQLWQGAVRLDLAGRYFDALVLLVREHGQLVEKDRFFDEVWGDVVVSDAALTQCIKDIRKQLGDAAASPRYIQTVPRYGYRFVGVVDAERATAAISPSPQEVPVPRAPSSEDPGVAAPAPAVARPFRRALGLGVAGTLGGAAAGVLGGLLYGLGLATTPEGPQLGTASLLLVLVGLNVAVGAVGGFGVSAGLAVASLARRTHPLWTVAGAALGGLLVGGLAKLLGIDAFTLLFGRAPAGITGGLEGAALGAALALGAHLGGGLGAPAPWRPVVGAAGAGAAVGLLIPAAGGALMGGSLELLARSFSGTQLQLDALGRFFGEVHFGETTRMVLGGVEGLLFGGCVVGAIVLAVRLRIAEA
jgi:DNA-binding winged helix-turn-helix (wHTH) protein